MHLDVADLRAFYSSPLGTIARRILSGRIRSCWRRVDGQVVIGLGFAAPYLGSFRAEAKRLGALMPAAQGALVWPASGAIHTVMVEEETLPLPDNSVDRLLAVHSLELAERTRPLLREMWRVLAPEGRLLLIVPHRRGIWARFDATPFGHGQPYSRAQLERILQESLFSPFGWSSALYMPPAGRRVVVRWSGVFERLGARLWPGFAGVLIVEARKELMAPIGGGLVRAARRSVGTQPAASQLAGNDIRAGAEPGPE